MGGSSPEVTEDELFKVLSNRRRRYVVHALKRDATRTDLGPLSERVAAWENEIDVSDVSHAERKRVYTALQQGHLPKMDEAGVVDFDKDRGVVEPTPALEDVDVYMDVVQGNEIPWSDYYLGLSAVCAALVGAVWVGAWPFVLLPGVAWTIAIVTAFAVSAMGHRYYTTEMELGGPNAPPELNR